MSFRARLFLFFVIIVVVPMIAVALVLFSLTKDSETGKADAQIAQGLRVAFGQYADGRRDARVSLDKVARDSDLAAALRAHDARAAADRARELARRYGVQAIAVYDASGHELAFVGPRDAIAPAVARPATTGGRRLGAVAVSTTRAETFARNVSRLAGLDIRVIRNGRLLGSTIAERGPPKVESGDVQIAGRDYRGRFSELDEAVGPPGAIGAFVPGGASNSAGHPPRIPIRGIPGAVPPRAPPSAAGGGPRGPR